MAVLAGQECIITLNRPMIVFVLPVPVAQARRFNMGMTLDISILCYLIT